MALNYVAGHRCTNSRHQVTQMTKFCMVAPNICRSSVWNLLRVTLLGPRVLRKPQILFFIPCIVKLSCNVNQPNAIFKFVLIQFLLSSTCFEHLMIIIRKTIMYVLPYIVCLPCVYASSLPG